MLRRLHMETSLRAGVCSAVPNSRTFDFQRRFRICRCPAATLAFLFALRGICSSECRHGVPGRIFHLQQKRERDFVCCNAKRSHLVLEGVVSCWLDLAGMRLRISLQRAGAPIQLSAQRAGGLLQPSQRVASPTRLVSVLSTDSNRRRANSHQQ